MGKRPGNRMRNTLAVVGLVLAAALSTYAGDFWGVRYGQSATEGGSSGAALLNAAGQVLGQLTGGNVTCDNVGQSGVYDIFGKFSVSWSLGLSDYLGGGKKSTCDCASVPPEASPTRREGADADAKPSPTPGETLKRPIAQPHVVVSAESIARAIEDLGAFSDEGSSRKMVGVHVDLPPIDPAAWERLVDDSGNASWRIAIHAPDAASIRLHFAEFPLAEGERAVVYDDPLDVVARPVTPTRTQTTADFWGPVVRGDTVVLEVVTASATPPGVVIDRISYGVRDPSSGAISPKEGDCYFDPSCYPAWRDVALGVSQMLFEVEEGQAVCTGTLLMDADRTFTPWLFSADHCINAQDEADSLIATFFYLTDSCNGPVPDWRRLPYTEGANLVARSSKTDFSLLRLDEDPPGGTVFLGWTTQEPDTGDDVTVLHHPGGTFMRISFADVIGEFQNTVFGDDTRSGGGDHETGCGNL